ncbi:tetratricopeptide repeat protein [Kitasatospora sp. NPDC048365]|uniref:tetratricopeptide repeat protein n=1 Tax=Kitasatospora sp. NPDC048365 TaxID=3364050 RepID=UPI0037136DF9
MTSNRTVAAGVALAKVMAHCGGNIEAALHQVAGAIAAAPADPEPYAVLAELRRERRDDFAATLDGAASLSEVLAQSYVSYLDGDMDGAALAIGSVCGVRPTVRWTAAPWFGDPGFLAGLTPDALAEAVMRTTDYGRPLDTDPAREALGPWIEAIGKVCEREPQPEAMARMAIFLRACGLTEASLALCDRADAVERVMLTEVVRAGTWRRLGDLDLTAAAFERALALDPDNWSLYLDLADVRALQDDFAEAVRLVERALQSEPDEPTLRAAGAAYRSRHTGSAGALREYVDRAAQLPPSPYRTALTDLACAGPGLPGDLVDEVRRALGGE